MGKYLELSKRGVPRPVPDRCETETGGTARADRPFPERVGDLVTLWAARPAPPGRWRGGQRGPMIPPAR